MGATLARHRWALIIAGPALFMLLGGLAAALFLPYPMPRTAAPAQRLWLTHCASCHGADGRGSWRATLFLMRPGDLADPQAAAGLTDQYLADLIKHGGATLGKPGMPAFGFHLSDAEVRALVAHTRALPGRQRTR